MIDIQKIIDGCNHCIYRSEYSYPCVGCPYCVEDDSTKHLIEDTVSALKRLQFLEKPTPEEQPELPGIPHVAYVILSSKSQNNNNDVEVYGVYMNEHETAELVNSLNLLNEERFWYQKSLLE